MVFQKVHVIHTGSQYTWGMSTLSKALRKSTKWIQLIWSTLFWQVQCPIPMRWKRKQHWIPNFRSQNTYLPNSGAKTEWHQLSSSTVTVSQTGTDSQSAMVKVFFNMPDRPCAQHTLKCWHGILVILVSWHPNKSGQVPPFKLSRQATKHWVMCKANPS